MSAVRIGMILPSVNTVMEPWLAAVLPAHVSVHTARMLMPDHITPAAIIEMDRTDGARALLQVASCRPHAAVHCCVVSSVVQGVAYDRELAHETAAAVGAPAETAAGAMLDALRVLGLGRIAAVSPYTDAFDSAEHGFLADAGIEVVASRHFGIASAFDLATPTRERMIDAALEADDPRAEGMLLSCMNMRSHLVVEELEQRLGKPVVSSTQAVLWKMLRLAGISDAIPGHGRLLRHH